MAGWKTHYLPDLCGLLKGYRMEHGGLSDLAAFAKIRAFEITSLPLNFSSLHHLSTGFAHSQASTCADLEFPYGGEKP